MYWKSILMLTSSCFIPGKSFFHSRIPVHTKHYMKSEQKIPRFTSFYNPTTPNQQKYVDVLSNSNHSLIFGIGPAGSGKTLFACTEAIRSLKNGQVKKIIITRPIISVEEDIGFLPGNIKKKMDPWLQPIYDIFLEYYTMSQIDHMIYNGVIEISPLGFMRGRTFKNVFIIADEMQNSTPNQMLMLLTRIGQNSRMVITGDINQSDIKSRNGLADFFTKYSCWPSKHDCNDIQMVFMNDVDVQRSSIVKSVLNIYDSAPSYNDNSVKTETMDAALIPRAHMTKYNTEL